MKNRQPPFDCKSALSRLPDQPGVYRMFSATGELLYVGKARNLKNRVRSYFQSSRNLSPKVAAMMQHVERFDYIVTDSEVEALILEYNLIKEHRPKYNILLRDDKKFPWIALSGEPFPRLFVTRDPERFRAQAKGRKPRFFGPYAHSGSMHRTLEVIRKHFPLRQRKKPLFKNRPCMNYYIGTCPGPCQHLVSEAEYDETVRQVEMFLKGKADDLLAMLETEMQAASESLNFEKAARLRDRYAAVQDVIAEQKMYYPDASVSQDIVAAAANERRCAVAVLKIRKGRLIETHRREIELPAQSSPVEINIEEAYNAFVTQYYLDLDTEDFPDELILQFPLEDEALLLDWLNRHKRRKARITYPQKGLKKELIDLGVKNAQEMLEQALFDERRQHRNDPAKALMELQETLGLPEYPARMECYDISHFQGSHTVASMVVFTNGMPDRKQYRRFKIRTAEGMPDDFRSMHEVIRRRFSQAVEDDSKWDEPDLVIIDGGKGQLGSAVAALNELGIAQPVVSLAKKFEEVYLPGESRPVILPRNSAALFILQQIRDEAHRFAVSYHRTLREKAAKKSVLDEIEGIGPRRKKALLDHFGSVGKMKQASLEELCQVSGITPKVAQILQDALRAG